MLGMALVCKGELLRFLFRAMLLGSESNANTKHASRGKELKLQYEACSLVPFMEVDPKGSFLPFP